MASTTTFLSQSERREAEKQAARRTAAGSRQCGAGRRRWQRRRRRRRLWDHRGTSGRKKRARTCKTQGRHLSKLQAGTREAQSALPILEHRACRGIDPVKQERCQCGPTHTALGGGLSGAQRGELSGPNIALEVFTACAALWRAWAQIWCHFCHSVRARLLKRNEHLVLLTCRKKRNNHRRGAGCKLSPTTAHLR